MELTSVTVKGIASKTLPWMEEVIVAPLGDIQYGAEECDVDRFQRHVEWIAKQPNAYTLGLGDYTDLASPSNRARLQSLITSGEVYDTVENALNDWAEERLGELVEIMKPLKGRCLGILEGHHVWPFPDGTTSDTRLAEALDAPYLGDCAITRVEFENAPKDYKGRLRAGCNIWSHHGEGSGQLQSAPLNKLERLAAAYEDVDVFFMAHQHKLVTAKIQKVRPVFPPAGAKVRPWMRHRNVRLAGIGGFLKGYMAGSQRGGRPAGGYVEKKMLTPVALGGVVLYIRPRVVDGLPVVDTSLSI